MEKEVQSTGDAWWRRTTMASHMYTSDLSAVSYSSSEFGDSRSLPSISNLEQRILFVIKNVLMVLMEAIPFCLTLNKPFLFNLTQHMFISIN